MGGQTRTMLKSLSIPAVHHKSIYKSQALKMQAGLLELDRIILSASGMLNRKEKPKVGALGLPDGALLKLGNV